MSHLLEPVPMERNAKVSVVVDVLDKAAGLENFTIGEGKTKGEMIFNDFFIHNTRLFHLKLVGTAGSNMIINEYMKKSIEMKLSGDSLALINALEGRLPASQKYTFYSIVKDGPNGAYINLKLPERMGKQYYVHTGVAATEDILEKKMTAIVAVGLYTSPRNYGVYLTLQSLHVEP